MTQGAAPGVRIALGRLLLARWRSTAALQASATATVAIAVATVVAVVRALVHAVASAPTSAPGRSAEELAEQVAVGAVGLATAAPALVLAVVVLAGAATSQQAGLLALARETETTTLRARGLSRRQGLAIDAIEAAVVGLAAGVLGWAVVTAGLALATGTGPGAVDVAVAAATAILLAGVRLRAVRRRRGGGSRGARVTTASGIVLLALAAALGLWQLHRALPGTVDPAVALAPTVVLLATALLALAAFVLGARAWSGLAARRPGLEPALTARQVARQLRVHAVVVVLVALATGQAVAASAFQATWQHDTATSAALRAGADLRVDLQHASIGPDDVLAAAAVPGVEQVAAALAAPAELGDTEAELVALPPQRVDDLLADADGIVDRGALRAAIAPAEGTAEAAPAALPEGATTLRVEADVTRMTVDRIERVRLSAVLVDSTGTIASIALPWTDASADGDDVRAVAEAELPEGRGAWGVLALTGSLATTVVASAPEVTFVAVEAGGEAIAIARGGRLEPETTGATLWAATPEGAGAGDAPVRVAVSRALADRLGIEEGDELALRIAGTGRRADLVVGGVVPAVPGALGDLGVLAPLDALTLTLLAADPTPVPLRTLLASGDVAAEAGLSAALGDQPVLLAAPDAAARVIGALVPAWWVAAAGSALLAMLAAAAAAQTLAIARRGEVAVLRALGVARRLQARRLAAELAGVLGAAVALGAAAGAIGAWLLVPPLVRATTPGVLALSDALRLEPGSLAAWAAALLGALAVVVGVAAAASARAAARSTGIRED